MKVVYIAYCAIATLLIAQCCSCSSGQVLQPVRHISMDEGRLDTLLASATPWPDGFLTTNYPEASWRYLIRIAKEIQADNHKSVEKALRGFQLRGCTNGDFQLVESEQKENDRKLLLLMRIIFNVPESVNTPEPLFGCFVTMRSDINPDGSFNAAWPMKWNTGHPILVCGFGGLQGHDPRYDAAREYHYFHSTYRFRDLSGM